MPPLGKSLIHWAVDVDPLRIQGQALLYWSPLPVYPDLTSSTPPAAAAVPPAQGRSPWLQFAISMGLVIVMFVTALYVGVYVNSQQALEKEILTRARAIFNSIVLARSWNAHYGGVYVEKKPGMQSNPYLVDPDIHATNGKTYTKKNPALMTREISEIANRSDHPDSFQFHITSLKLLNPGNTPDDFERRALESFEQGQREAVLKDTRQGVTSFRYMAPLFFEPACLECHAAQGYKVGDVRGGISIRMNTDAMERAQKYNRRYIALLFTLTLAAFLGIVYRLVATLRQKLLAAQETIRIMSITDELTQLKNRRFLLSRLSEELDRANRYQHPLACIFFDIDHFKKINDNHNHEIGDEVLKAVAATAQSQCRQTDALGRWGGEEFLMLLPETSMAQAVELAERLRVAVQNQDKHYGVCEIPVTISLGVTCYEASPGSVQPDTTSFIMLADNAMLAAKEAGRNRVCSRGAELQPG